MGARGPLPKRQQQRRQDRDPKARQTSPGPEVAPDIPEPPGWLLEEGREEWERVVPLLHQAGMLAALDRTALACYCQTWAQYQRCQHAILVNGQVVDTKSGPKTRPEVSISANLMKEIRQFCALFGLAPGSRMRMEVPGPDAKELDEFTSLLD